MMLSPGASTWVGFWLDPYDLTREIMRIGSKISDQRVKSG